MASGVMPLPSPAALVPLPAGKSRARSWARRAEKIAPSAAVPTEPPTNRNSVTPDVPTPRSV